MAEGPRGRNMTGARGRLLADGRKIGWVMGLDITATIALDEIEPIDTIVPEEIVSLGMRTSWSARLVHIVLRDDFVGTMWFASLDELVAGGREFSIQILDTITGEAVASLEGVKTGSLNITGAGREVWAKGVSGAARLMKLETQPDLRLPA